MHVTPDIRYASFMLRLQWMENDDHPAWVFSMQSTKTGELRWFPNLEALVHFLRDEFGDCETKGASHLAILSGDIEGLANRHRHE